MQRLRDENHRLTGANARLRHLSQTVCEPTNLQELFDIELAKNIIRTDALVASYQSFLDLLKATAPKEGAAVYRGDPTKDNLNLFRLHYPRGTKFKSGDRRPPPKR